MVKKNDVKNTKTYKGLTKIQQMIVLNWNKVTAINQVI